MPPGVKARWEDMTPAEQTHLLAFDQVASYDEMETQAALAGAKI